MAIGDIYRAVATFTGPQAQTCQWVWHYRQVSGTDDTSTDILDDIEVIFRNAWDEIVSNIDANFVGDVIEILVWDFINNRFDGEGTVDISDLVGGALGAGDPANVAPYVTFPTNRPKSLGKKFIFGIQSSALVDGQLTAGTLAALALFAANFNDQVNSTNGQYRPCNFNPNTEVSWLWSTSEVGVGAFSGSQYRRLPGRGS